jgi:hypothetical protein
MTGLSASLSVSVGFSLSSFAIFPFSVLFPVPHPSPSIFLLSSLSLVHSAQNPGVICSVKLFDDDITAELALDVCQDPMNIKIGISDSKFHLSWSHEFSGSENIAIPGSFLLLCASSSPLPLCCFVLLRFLLSFSCRFFLSYLSFSFSLSFLGLSIDVPVVGSAGGYLGVELGGNSSGINLCADIAACVDVLGFKKCFPSGGITLISFTFSDAGLCN